MLNAQRSLHAPHDRRVVRAGAFETRSHLPVHRKGRSLLHTIRRGVARSPLNTRTKQISSEMRVLLHRSRNSDLGRFS